MKRCPECRRDYYDDSLLYCLDDGNALLDGPASGRSEPPASAGGRIDWQHIFEKYSELRKPNTDAIQDMAVENFYEMRDAVADPVFVKKRELETKLEQTYPDYFSKYSMVTFREDLAYSTAKARGNAQDNLLMQICAETADIAGLDLDALVARLHGLRI